MNILDILIIIALLASLVSGYRRGFWVALAQYAGAVAGILVGARFAPAIVDRLGVTDPTGRQFVAVLVLVVASSIGGSIGFWLVGPLRRRLLTTPLLGVVDSLGGAVLSAAVTLFIVWLLALTFARGPVPELARVIQQSRIVRELDAALPVPPSFIARVQQLLSGTFLPPVFIGIEPELPSSSVPLPESVNTEGVRTAAASTVRVEGLGCGGIATGSGFVVGENVVVTNAHVVSGTNGTTVSTPDGRRRQATVMGFDAGLDLAVLRVPGLNLPALLPGEARAGTQGAVIGYPGGGPLTVNPAVVDRGLTATGRDIHNRRQVERDIWVITARVRSGNSGGPVVDEQGRYIGVVFASSVSSPGQAYALTAEEALPAIQEAANESETVDAGDFPCVR